MAITAADIVFRLSGGAANTDPAAALGGDMSTAGGGVITKTTTPNSLFDDVPSAESAAGDTEYRSFYVYNAHATLTYQNAKIKIDTQTPSGDTIVGIGAEAAEGITGGQSVVNENTAPSAPVITFEETADAWVTLGDIGPESGWQIWVRRVISASAAAADDDGTTFAVTGDTTA